MIAQLVINPIVDGDISRHKEAVNIDKHVIAKVVDKIIQDKNMEACLSKLPEEGIDR